MYMHKPCSMFYIGVLLTSVVVYGDGGADEAEVGDDRTPVAVQHDVVRLAGHNKGGTQKRGTQIDQSDRCQWTRGLGHAITLVRVHHPFQPFSDTLSGPTLLGEAKLHGPMLFIGVKLSGPHLEVPVHGASFVQVVHALGDIEGEAEEVVSLLLVLEEVGQGPALEEAVDEAAVGGGDGDAVEAAEVGVADAAHDGPLPLEVPQEPLGRLVGQIGALGGANQQGVTNETEFTKCTKRPRGMREGRQRGSRAAEVAGGMMEGKMEVLRTLTILMATTWPFHVPRCRLPDWPEPTASPTSSSLNGIVSANRQSSKDAQMRMRRDED